MEYISTRGGMQPIPFRAAVMTGLAPDGGLLLPRSYPDVRAHLPAWEGLSYADLAVEVMALFTDLPRADLQRLVRESCAAFDHPEVTPLRRVGDRWLLELFHGPTLAFKDVALQWLGRLFEYLLAREGGDLNILGATSGDTGSAAIHGVRGRRGIRIFILYPLGRVSPAQELQMATVPDANVHAFALEGTFDDCQDIVKELFRDLDFKRERALGAVNSINWARVLAQVVYYLYAALRVRAETGGAPVSFSVPTGNFGDVFAGYVAWRMGAPIRRLLVATNENDILARFFLEGEYRRGHVVPTLSPSMDIQVASNFERYLFHRCGDDPALLRAQLAAFAATGVLRAADLPPDAAPCLFAAGRADRAATLATMAAWQRQHGVLLDPHSAVGVAVADTLAESDEPVVCLATAHPAKFPDAVREALGHDAARHERLEALRGLPLRRTILPAQAVAVRARMEQLLDG